VDGNLQWEATASLAGDVLASTNFGICDTTLQSHISVVNRYQLD
jgi:hypothetical protein